MTSTLWLFGQYLGWVEILRREAEPLNLGSTRENRRLQDRFAEVASALAKASSNGFVISEPEQQAVGEAMIEEVRAAEGDGSNGTTLRPMSYGDFTQRVRAEPPPESVFLLLSSRFDEVLPQLAKRESDAYKELANVQRALVDLIDVLDRHQVRFPRRDDRAKVSGRRDAEPNGGDVIAQFEPMDWAETKAALDEFKEKSGLKPESVDGSREHGSPPETVYMPRSWIGRTYQIVVSYDGPRVTIRASTKRRPWSRGRRSPPRLTGGPLRSLRWTRATRCLGSRVAGLAGRRTSYSTSLAARRWSARRFRGEGSSSLSSACSAFSSSGSWIARRTQIRRIRVISRRSSSCSVDGGSQPA